jgi:hypothetical protein
MPQKYSAAPNSAADMAHVRGIAAFRHGTWHYADGCIVRLPTISEVNILNRLPIIRRASATLAIALASNVFLPAVAASTDTQPRLAIPSVKSLDPAQNRVVFPLHRGDADGKTVWYILTDVSDQNEAASRGLVFAPAIAGVGTVQTVTGSADAFHFEGAPDFSMSRVFKAGPTGFPPAAAAPGAVAGNDYSPFVSVGGSSIVYNAPIVATGDGPFDVTTHTNTADRVLAIDKAAGTVTLLLARGYASGKQVLYISTEASDPGAAVLERATLDPGLAHSSPASRLAIYAFANGQTGAKNSQAQGFAHLALDGNLDRDATAENSASLGSPLNILGGLPSFVSRVSIYSPLWNASIGAWSKPAVAAHRNVRLTTVEQADDAAAAGDLTAPDGKPFGPVGIVVNCPVVAVYL